MQIIPVQPLMSNSLRERKWKNKRKKERQGKKLQESKRTERGYNKGSEDNMTGGK